ncbi:MAG: AfsR/SARP family transcriptional regulator [Elainellaceae cyanobacterium]
MEALLTIRLLGQFQIEYQERTINQFRTRKTAGLLSYLAYYLGHAQPREKLIDLLWPDVDLTAGRNSLRVALNSLRHQMHVLNGSSNSVLLVNRSAIQLNSNICTTDVTAFGIVINKAHQTQDLEQRIANLTTATQIYRGELLPEFYDDWVVRERQRLSDAYLEVLCCLTHLLIEQQDFRCALEYAHQAIEIDSLHEQAHCNLIRVYAAMGRPSAALRQYQELKLLFQRELNCRPSITTQTLVRQIQEQLS